MLIMPTHRDDVDAHDRAMTIWQTRGPKWQPFGNAGRPLAALRHADGRAKVQTVPEGVDPQELVGDGWELVAVIPGRECND